MHIAVLILAVLAVLVGPGLWVKSVMKRYSRPQDRYEQTGGAVARELLDAHGLEAVAVEASGGGDHYDPVDRVIRLMPEHLEQRSLAAVTIAAHEVGHAVQDASGYAPLKWRTRLVRWLGPVEKIGAGVLMSTPLIIALTRHPVAGLLAFAGGFLALGTGVLIHLMTLPTEFDASFKRALPMLEKSGVLYRTDAPHARKLLRAAAMTYVSASLMSLLNVARWWAILRR
ncbi:MAG TPA: zinc metallopeptidase [Burkholderiales bacterium]|nr:zinc metallopeptidase [Burkholderiales bacterium]